MVETSQILVLIGCVGVGKSTFGNMLSGDSTFAVGENMDGITKTITSTSITLNENNFIVFDTPGVGDWDVT